jgi:translocation and assembly module TamB
MSEPNTRPLVRVATQAPRRWRRMLLLAGCVAFIVIAAPLSFYIWSSSAPAQALARARVIADLEKATGGAVEIASFHWQLLTLTAQADGLVVHGREAIGEQPLARIDRASIALSVLGIWSPRILLRDLTIERPALHLIVYPDGSTNVPHPRSPARRSKPALNTLFDLEAGHIAVQQGTLHFESRASEFDFQNRYALLDFAAEDVSALMRFIPAAGAARQSYSIEAGATNLSLLRGKEKPSVGAMQATLELTRTAATLRSLRITSRFPDDKKRASEEHTVEFSGQLVDFSHPHWKATTTGEMDMRLLNPVFGYPFAPEGIARLHLDSAGEGGEFRTDGSIHIDNGSYIGTGVVATGLGLDAHVHADPRQLLITQVVARLRQGGRMEGEVKLAPWLPPSSSLPQLEPAPEIPRSGSRSAGRQTSKPAIQAWHPPPPPNPDVIIIPVNGKVTAEFKGVSLDALLDMVGQAPFQRLGLDTEINGTTHANWVKGDQGTLAVNAMFNLTPSAKGVSGEVPATSLIDATYLQKDGSVDVRRFELHTSASEITASGRLGAYPLTSPTTLNVDFHSHNLNDFDGVLRDLGLNRYGKSGAAALPIALGGEMDFLHGAWTGSLAAPRLAGNLKATALSIEMPAIHGDPNAPASDVPRPSLVHFDSVELTGSYAPERIAISHGKLDRGKSEVALDGTLDASGGESPEFDLSSMLHLHMRAAQVELDDLLPMTGKKLPLSGTLDAQLEADGPLRAPGGSGWVELNDATAYGEPVTRMRVQGTLAKDQLRFSSINTSLPAGGFSASGSFDLESRHFQINAKGAGIDVAKIQLLHREDPESAGTLGFSVSGSGTLDDPRIEANATLNGLALGGEPLGTLTFAAHTADRNATYTASTRLSAAELAGAELDLDGQTALSGDYRTKAKLAFSHFDIGGILRAAHVQGLTGQSALAGTVTLEGPLARPIEFRGEARLEELAATVAGVRLESQGGAHATLFNGRINLDPLHITGEDTDLRAQGSLALKDKQQLDIAASGSINLKLAETIDPDITASGTTTFQVEAHGSLKNPDLRGRVDFQNGSLSLEDVPNGLSQLHGTLEFNQDRLEVKSLTAMSGGGLLSVGGYLAYQHGVYANLSVSGKGVRIRYPQGVSSLADIGLHLQGSQKNLLLGGDVLITRFSVSTDLDLTALAAQANAVSAIAPPDAPSNHVRLDVQVTSSPQLNFQNAYAKLAGNVDLHLRGTVATPSLLGSVSITEGSATIAGTRYDLQRGEISFTNPVRIEPSIDLNATARVEDYDITLGLHGTPAKLDVSYRSDPPLPEPDVVALLALGRTENQQRIYTQQQQQSVASQVASPTTDALLGGALNATVSSRVQKLFGAGSVKVDPNYIGTLGNSTSRITVEEQLGRNVTLTYATNVDTTGQQLLQAEIAINRHLSLLVARDESGVFSMVLKFPFRYR